MGTLTVSVLLPHHLLIEDGAFQVAGGRNDVHVREFTSASDASMRTTVRMTIDRPAIEDVAGIREFKQDFATDFLRIVNQFLRWYRLLHRRHDVIELTPAQAHPFLFTAFSTGSVPCHEDWTLPVWFDTEGPKARLVTVDVLTREIRDALASGREPDMDELRLMDATHAVMEGRFREAVLLAWSTIDSTFIRRFDRLVDESLAGEWSDAIRSLKGTDLGLRVKMTAGLRLLTGRSLFQESDEFWPRLSASYAVRNNIIHRGDNATEREANDAIQVGRDLIVAMTRIQAKQTF